MQVLFSKQMPFFSTSSFSRLLLWIPSLYNHFLPIIIPPLDQYPSRIIFSAKSKVFPMCYQYIFLDSNGQEHIFIRQRVSYLKNKYCREELSGKIFQIPTLNSAQILCTVNLRHQEEWIRMQMHVLLFLKDNQWRFWLLYLILWHQHQRS